MAKKNIGEAVVKLYNNNGGPLDGRTYFELGESETIESLFSNLPSGYKIGEEITILLQNGTVKKYKVTEMERNYITGYELIDPLPPHSSSDNGKVLGLNDGTLTWVPQPDTSGKIDKVINANGNLPKFDSNGNLINSEIPASSVLTSHQNISGKADKVNNATNNNFAALDGNGNLKDSGAKSSDFIPMPSGSDGQILEKDSNEANGVKWSNKPSDGASAYEIWLNENNYQAVDHPVQEFLASLKAQFGSFVPALYCTDTGHEGKPGDSSNNLITPDATTLNYIYLVDNAATNHTAKTMWITVVDDSDPNEYDWTSIGDVQVDLTFGSGQALNEVKIKDENGEEVQGAADVLSAEAGRQLAVKLEGVTASETKVQLVTSGEGQNVYDGYIDGETGLYHQSIYNSFIVASLNGAKKVRFLAKENSSNDSKLGWAFGTFSGAIDATISNFTPLSYGVFKTNSLNNQAVEYVEEVPDDTTHVCITIWKYPEAESAVNLQNFYCYLQRGETVVDLVNETNVRVFGDSKKINVQLGKVGYNGAVAESDTTYINADFIEIPQGRTSIIWNPGSTGAYYLVMYDVNFAPINSLSYLANGTPRTISMKFVSDIAKYIRATFDKDTINDCYLDVVKNNETIRLFSPIISVEEGIIDKTFPKEPTDNKVPSTKLINDYFIGCRKTLYAQNQYNWISSKYIDYEDGTVHNSTVNSITDFIDIKGCDSVELVMSIVTGLVDAGVSFYDENRNYLSGVPQNIGLQVGYEYRKLQVPNNAKYIRCSLLTSYTQYWFLTYIKESKILPKSKAQKITLEFGNLDERGEIESYSEDFFDNMRTSLYYKLNHIRLPYNYTVYVYSSDYSFVRTLQAEANTEYALNCDNWHKVVINFDDNSITSKKEIVIDLDVVDTSFNLIPAKTTRTGQYLVKYKKGRGIYTQDPNHDEAASFENLISNTIRFYLPTNYSPTGEPVKLVYYAHGTSGFAHIDTTGWNGFDNAISYLADEGFALYDMFAGTSYYNALTTNRIANYNLPIQLAAQKDAYEWIVRNFNVDPQIYVVGYSHGGLAGIYATNNIVPTRAVALLAPLITQIGDRYSPWGLIYESECWMCLDDMCFIPPEGTTFNEMVNVVHTKADGWKSIVLDNIRQQSGLNPYLNGITNVSQETLLTNLMNDVYQSIGGMDSLIRHSDVPVKVWCAVDDDQVIYANGYNWIKSLQNGGSNAQFREFPAGYGGHQFAAFTGDVSLKNTVITSLGVEWTVSRVYAEVVNFLNQF